MIMPRGHQLLLPANPLFIIFSLVFACLIDMLLSMAFTGNAAWMPDFVAAVLVFWAVHQPMRVGIGTAFVLGLLLDVHQSSLLGQHALSFTAQGFLATMIHRRLLWFSVSSQAMQVLPVFAICHLLELIVRLSAGGFFPGWALIFAPIIQAIFWPMVTALLLAPQRRAPNPDENRPL